jgi:hypothetical protein
MCLCSTEQRNIQLEDVKQAILAASQSTSLDIALSLVASFNESNQQLLHVLVTVLFLPATSNKMKEIEHHIMEQIQQLEQRQSRDLIPRLEEKRNQCKHCLLSCWNSPRIPPWMSCMLWTCGPQCLH